jgi:hypothetical protein
MDAKEVAHKRELLGIYRANLRSTELQAAQYGSDIPIKIQNDIAFYTRKIQELEGEIKGYEESVLASLKHNAYDCTSVVTSSRPLTSHGTGDACWLKLSKGSSTELLFNERAQITYGTSTGGDDSFFYIAEKGDRLRDVTGATIRPMLYIIHKFGGSLEAVKKHEIEYHSKMTACLRDANDTNKPLTESCY